MPTTDNRFRYYIAIIMMAISSVSYATTITVTSTTDAGAGSLRQAVMDAAASGDTIRFASAIDGMPIGLTTGEITLNKNLVILGNSTTNTIIDGMGDSRVFHIPTGDTIDMLGITLQNGNGKGAITSGIGGAVLNQGTTNFTNAILSGNSAASSGGALYNTGTVTFTNTIISGNTASMDGGGVYNSFGTAIFTNSSLSGNVAANIGGGVFSTGVIAISSFTNTIVAKNSDLGVGPDVFDNGVTIIDGGYNLIGDGSGQIAILNGMNNNQVGPDPLFIMDVPTAPSTGGDLRLACGSPGIDGGMQDTMGLNLGLVDILGLPRIENGTIDIGAYERPADAGTKIVTILADDGLGSLRDIVLTNNTSILLLL